MLSRSEHTHWNVMSEPGGALACHLIGGPKIRNNCNGLIEQPIIRCEFNRKIYRLEHSVSFRFDTFLVPSAGDYEHVDLPYFRLVPLNVLRSELFFGR